MSNLILLLQISLLIYILKNFLLVVGVAVDILLKMVLIAVDILFKMALKSNVERLRKEGDINE